MGMETKLFIAGVLFFIISRIMHEIYKKNHILKESRAYITALDWIDTIWSAVILGSIIMFFIIQAFKIPSGSMRLTLLEGDHLFVNKFIYGIHVPFAPEKRILPIRRVHRKDIIIFRCPDRALSQEENDKGITKDFIKRCVGLPGDTIEIKNKKVYVNGQLVEETYTHFEDSYILPKIELFKTREQYQKSWEEGRFTQLRIGDNFGPIKVPDNCYFAMGDNRDRSFDSRFWGPVPDRLLKGQALIIYWPLNRIRIIK